MSEASFHLKLLSNYQLVSKPGTHYVSAAYTVTNANLLVDEHPRYIVPFRAITGDGLNQIIFALNGDATKKVPFKDLRHLFLAGALWCGEDDLIDEADLPVKGEKMLATFDYKDIDSERVLVCTHLELLPREELEYVDTDNLDEFKLTIKHLLTKA